MSSSESFNRQDRAQPKGFFSGETTLSLRAAQVSELAGKRPLDAVDHAGDPSPVQATHSPRRPLRQDWR